MFAGNTGVFIKQRKSGPLIPALFNLMVGAYSKKELISLILKAGFTTAKIAITSKDLAARG